MSIKNMTARINKRVISISLAVLLAISCITSSFVIVFAEESTPPVRIVPDSLGGHVAIHSELQESYLSGSLHFISGYANGVGELSRPAKITLSWNTEIDEAYAAANGVSAEDCDYTLYFGKTDNFSDARIYYTKDTSYQVTNLELDTTYYWKVASEIGEKSWESETASFTTERNGPRNLYVSGITNVRDIGGYTTLNGDTVKQGRIIRCGELNSSSGSRKITDKGISQMRDDLGIKTEIDLRRKSTNEYGGITGSMLGDDVNYYLLPMDPSKNMIEGPFIEDNISSIRGVFEVLAEEENYPVIFHCAIGTDRTGMIAYCIEALLGMSETDIIRDYLFSNFGSIGSSRSVSSISSSYPKFIKNFDGRTLQEKTYRFLNEYIGVPAEKLDAVIRMNLIPCDDTVRGEPISSQADFLAMKNDGNYYLTQDFSLSACYNNQFFGTLDGNGHTVTTTEPLFQNLSGMVKNLTIRGSVSASDGRMIGALAREGSRFTCIRVNNYADVTMTAQYYAGGLVGYSNVWSKYIDCENHGSIRSAYHAAGIVCRALGELSFSNCLNDGAVTAEPSADNFYAGGMVAKCSGAVMMQGCRNNGPITGAGAFTGGLGGYLDTDSVMKTVISCENSGIVACDDNAQELSYMGGIVGFMNGGKSYCTFSNCRNSGLIRSDAGGKVILSGICGYVDSESLIVAHCSNEGGESAPAASENVCYHLYYDPAVPEKKYIHDNDPWIYDNVSFMIEGAGTFNIPHEMTFGEWIMTTGCPSGNSAVWVSPVTGFTEDEIMANRTFFGEWALYRDDEQGKLYAEIPSHRSEDGSIILPQNGLLNPNGLPLTIYELITPNSEYRLSDHDG